MTADPNSDSLHDHAKTLLSSITPSTTPATLHDLLTTTIKPLFQQTPSQKLTQTGRKNQLPAPPPIPGQFSTYDSLFTTPPWKNNWTVPLLLEILTRYHDILPPDLKKSTIESHFFLLIPPILKLTDDVEISYKAQGCQALYLLSRLLVDVESDMMHRTGLTEVFVDALKANFIYLPTLTDEDESLSLLKELYPAYFALVEARFILSSTSPPKPTSSTSTSKPPPKSETTQKQTLLTTLLRHSLLYSLAQLSPNPSSPSTTTSPKITTYLISQFTPLMTAMSAHASVHLQVILPLLRDVLSDPFATSHPEMLIEGIGAMEAVIAVCSQRVGDKWWSECLRGLVACWVNVLDDEVGVVDVKMAEAFAEVKSRLRNTVSMLESLVGNGFVETKVLLIAEEGDLQDLFNPKHIT